MLWSISTWVYNMLFLPQRAIWTRHNQKPVVMFLGWINTYVAACRNSPDGRYLHWFINRMQWTTIMNSTSTNCSSTNCCDELNICHLIEELLSVGYWFAKTSGQVINHSSLLKYQLEYTVFYLHDLLDIVTSQISRWRKCQGKSEFATLCIYRIFRGESGYKLLKWLYKITCY
jgi:hypothetical protein